MTSYGRDRNQKIEKLEDELSTVNRSLEQVMEHTVLMLSRRQKEMDRWSRLESLTLDRWPQNVGEAEGAEKQRPNQRRALKEGPSSAFNDCSRQSNPKSISTVQHRELGATDSTTIATLHPSHRLLDESMLSPATASKLERMLQHEARVRGLLSGMKDALNRSADSAPSCNL